MESKRNFSLYFQAPVEQDGISAAFKSGLLCIAVPKTEDPKVGQHREFLLLKISHADILFVLHRNIDSIV
jgi:hypothetical protein